MKPSWQDCGTWSVSDRLVLAGAAAAWCGALAHRPVPLAVMVALAVAGLVSRHPLVGAIALVVVTSGLAARAVAGLDDAPDGPFDGPVTLLTDPEPTFDGRLRVEVDSEHGHLLADVRSPSAVDALDSALAGERAVLAGTVAAFDTPNEWVRSRHLAGRLRVESVRATSTGTAITEAANRFRRLLDAGSSSLPDRQRSLLAGLVLGDDRAQPPQLTADFRAAGLTHLLAVSGQNVAFVLMVAAPFVARVRIWPRFLASVAVVASFAMVTRFEPSVVRAAFVAAVALFAHTTGRPSGGLRHLAVAVCLLLLVDPLLVHSLGFRLSVAASAGVLVIAPHLVARLPGPSWFRTGLGVTAGAQLAVAPVLVPVLGPMPLAALPANLVAGPLAGVLMVWGLTAGVVAGAVGGPVAWLLHRPSALGLSALEAVAGAGASLPLGHVDLRHIAVVALAAATARLGRRRGRVLGLAMLTVAMIAPPLTPTPLGARPAGYDATVWVDGPVAVVDVGARASPVAVLDTLRSAEVAAVGLVAVRTSRPSGAAVVEAIASRFPIGAVVGPPGLSVDDVVVPPDGLRVSVGCFVVVVDEPGPPMRVRIGWADGDRHSRAMAVPGGAAPAIGSPGAHGPRHPLLRRHPPGARRGHRRRRQQR